MEKLNVEDDDSVVEYKQCSTLHHSYSLIMSDKQLALCVDSQLPNNVVHCLLCADDKNVFVGLAELQNMFAEEPAFKKVFRCGPDVLKGLDVSSTAFNIIRFCVEKGHLPNNLTTKKRIISGELLNTCYILGGFPGITKMIQMRENQAVLDSSPIPKRPSDDNAQYYEWRTLFEKNSSTPSSDVVNQLIHEGFNFGSSEPIGTYTYAMHYRRLK